MKLVDIDPRLLDEEQLAGYVGYLEGLRLSDPFAALGYEPTAKQQELHSAQEFDVLFGGQAGGGKTLALLMEAIRACVEHPGIVVGAFRRTYAELDESFIAELAKVRFCADLGAAWLASKRDLVFPNRSQIRFRYAETLQDATIRQGSEMQLLIIDERTLVVPAVVDFLMTRLRSGDPSIPVLGVRSGTNPGGIGHAAVKERYVLATNHGERIVTDERGRSVRFIPARLSDNPYINSEYAKDLLAIPDPQLRRALAEGDWDSFAGAVFGEWSRDRHVVEPFALPRSWSRVAGIDWGFAAPWGVLWLAEDEDGRLWVYRELYAVQVGEHEQARRILAAEAEDGNVLHVGDPAMAARRGDAESITSAYERERCYVEPANNDRLAGWARIHEYLADGPACPHHRAKGWESCPRLHVFATCANLIRTLPAAPHDPHRVEDLDTRCDDHLLDCLRYGCLEFGNRPQYFIGADTPPVPYASSDAPPTWFEEHGMVPWLVPTATMPGAEGEEQGLAPYPLIPTATPLGAEGIAITDAPGRKAHAI